MPDEQTMVPTIQKGALTFIAYSLLGIFMFFYPLTLGGKTTIPIDHIIGAIRNHIPQFGPVYAIAVMLWGTWGGIRNRTWRRSVLSAFFFVFQLLGLIIGLSVVSGVGPDWLLSKEMAPYVFKIVAIPVGLIIPIGSIFLAFLVSFGLMEFTGEFMTPVMRPVFHTPGKSAIDAVASFVGSYSVGLIITNNLYKNGGYTARQASIIATGFSTVSATFMIIVAKTLGLMEMWGTYFWVTLFVTFLVTAITVRIPPLSRIPEALYPGTTAPDEIARTGEGVWVRAWRKGVETAATSPGFLRVARKNILDGVRMATTVVAAILSFGVLALALTKYTSLFDYTAYLFYPFFRLLGLPDALLGAKAASITLADMFAPAIIAAEAAPVMRFVLAVLAISEILFFSGMLPCLFGTEIPLKLRDVFFIWFERVVLTVLLTAPIAYMLF